MTAGGRSSIRPTLAQVLDLAPHPEGGWYRETWRSPLELTGVPTHPGTRSAGTAIYYLLSPGESSAWHRVRSAELWFWHRGGPLTLTLGGDGEVPGEPVDLTLGGDVEAAAHPQALVAPNVWQSARPATGIEVLVSCVVVPGFDFADFRLAPPPAARGG